LDILTASLQEARRQFEARQAQHVRLNAAVKVGIQQYAGRLVQRFQLEGTKCLHAYTTEQYKLVNRALRTPGSWSSKSTQAIIDGATRALRIGNFLGLLKGCVADAVLYRGCAPLAEVPKAGGTFSDRAFLSTTWKLSTAVRFMEWNHNQEPLLFRILNARTAGYLRDLSAYKHEGEFLFPPSTMFRVLSVKPGQVVKGARGKVTVIEMSEMTIVGYG